MARLRSFVHDLVFDLRERRLLVPAVALALAAVAVPVILGGSEPAAPPAPSAAPEVVETEPAVAESVESGVRVGDSRLSGEQPSNPFRQQLRSTPGAAKIDDAGAGALEAEQSQLAAADQLAEQLGAGDGTVEQATAPVGDSDSTEKPSAPTEPRIKQVVKLERHSIDVRFGREGARQRVNGLEALDRLPRGGDAVAVFLGTGDRADRATFDVADRVAGVWGKGKCAGPGDECDYLTLRPGSGAKLRYQPPARREGDDRPAPIVYSLTLVEIHTKRVSR